MMEHIDHAGVLVDFGTWIGYTVLFGAQIARRTYGLEADPAAFAAVRTNLLLNAGSAWSERVHLQASGVGVKSELASMYSVHPGNSCSGFGNKTAGCWGPYPASSWTVQVYSLAFLFQHWSVPESPMTFVKVDVEGLECSLVPSWLPWLRGMETKPTFLIAFHSDIVRCTDEQYAAVAELVHLYGHVREIRKSLVVLDRRGRFTGGKAEVLFTDRLVLDLRKENRTADVHFGG